MSGVLVVVELAQGKPVAASLELLGLARSLAAQAGGGVSALVFSGDAAIAAALVARGADKVYVATDPAAADYNSDVWLAYAGRAVSATGASLVLAAHTTKGADLAPRLAFRLKSAAAPFRPSCWAGRSARFLARCWSVRWETWQRLSAWMNWPGPTLLA